MPVVASQSLGAEPSPSAVPPLTVSPPHDLPRNPLPNVNLFQHGGLGFHSNDIGPEHANSLPPSLPSTDSPVQQPHGSPDDVHTTSSELQSFIKNPGASDNGEQFKLGPAGDAVDGLSKRRRTAKSNPSAVPLFCSACPHRPHFSDLSHLLTHLGSRGHTKYEFDARVRADTKTDPAAIKVIEEYDVWFKENNISQMLAARMNDKEKKKQEREEGEVAKRKKSSNRTTVCSQVLSLALLTISCVMGSVTNPCKTMVSRRERERPTTMRSSVTRSSGKLEMMLSFGRPLSGSSSPFMGARLISTGVPRTAAPSTLAPAACPCSPRLTLPAMVLARTPVQQMSASSPTTSLNEQMSD